MSEELPGPTPAKAFVILDAPVRSLFPQLIDAGLEVVVIPMKGQLKDYWPVEEGAHRIRILITTRVGHWITGISSPADLGVSLVNVAAITEHPKGCAAVVLEALADSNVPKCGLYWLEFKPDGHWKLFVFAGE